MYEQYGYFNDDLLNYEFIILGQTLIKILCKTLELILINYGRDRCIKYRTTIGVKTNKGKENTKLTLPVSDVYRVLLKVALLPFALRH